jgi:hypothetical protein
MGPNHYLDYAERLLRWFWRHHYRVPPWAYWLILGTSVLTLTPLQYGASLWFLALAGLGLTISVMGIVRWANDRRFPTVVAVPLFAAESSSRANEVQRLIVTTLRDHIGPIIPPIAIRPIPMAIDPSDKSIPHRIRRRLNALYLLYGEVRERSEGGYSVHARLNCAGGSGDGPKYTG